MRAERDRCTWMRPVDGEEEARYVLSLSMDCQVATPKYLACEDAKDPACQYIDGSPPCTDLQEAMWRCDDL